MKKRLLCLVLLLVFCLPLAMRPSTVRSEEEKTVVTVWTMVPEDSEPTSGFQRYKRVLEDFTNNNDKNIEVEFSGTKTADVILTSVASGETPDIFQNYWNNAPTWADKGALYDMTEFVNGDEEWDKSDFLDQAWALCTYNDHIYSVPSVASTTLMVYRKDILAENGWDTPPKTMEELIQCIKDTTVISEDGEIERLGMVPDLPWLDNVLWPAAFGAPWMDGDKPNFNNPQMLKAYQFQRDIFDEYGYNEVKTFSGGFGGQSTAEDPLLQGQVASAWFLDNWLASMEKYGEDVEWDIAPMPVGEGSDGGQMLTVGVWEMNSKTPHPDAAWDVLAALTSKEAMQDYAMGDFDYGTFMSRKSALNFIIDEPGISERVKQVAKIFLDEELISFPMLPYTGEYLNVINSEMDAALAGEQTVDEAAEAVQAQVEEIAQQ